MHGQLMGGHTHGRGMRGQLKGGHTPGEIGGRKCTALQHLSMAPPSGRPPTHCRCATCGCRASGCRAWSCAAPGRCRSLKCAARAWPRWPSAPSTQASPPALPSSEALLQGVRAGSGGWLWREWSRTPTNEPVARGRLPGTWPGLAAGTSLAALGPGSATCCHQPVHTLPIGQLGGQLVMWLLLCDIRLRQMAKPPPLPLRRRVLLASHAVERLQWSAFPALETVRLQVRGRGGDGDLLNLVEPEGATCVCPRCSEHTPAVSQPRQFVSDALAQLTEHSKLLVSVHRATPLPWSAAGTHHTSSPLPLPQRSAPTCESWTCPNAPP